MRSRQDALQIQLRPGRSVAGMAWPHATRTPQALRERVARRGWVPPAPGTRPTPAGEPAARYRRREGGCSQSVRVLYDSLSCTAPSGARSVDDTGDASRSRGVEDRCPRVAYRARAGAVPVPLAPCASPTPQPRAGRDRCATSGPPGGARVAADARCAGDRPRSGAPLARRAGRQRSDLLDLAVILRLYGITFEDLLGRFTDAEQRRINATRTRGEQGTADLAKGRAPRRRAQAGEQARARLPGPSRG
jgi:hypothetical protein